MISYEDLSNGIREMSKELPASTTEISAVAEAAGQLGIETGSVLSFTRTMIDMGESTNLSANDAATALARFANITGMSQKDFGRLGSSIVALGNNFATTESEIVQMALRLAGAGSQVGMSESEILALSAALSSVGIEAEAGGSAFSKVMVNMQLAAAKGGVELEAFAKVAGMSASDFKKAFEEDAVGAIGAFVEGLGSAEEKGTTAIELLDEMGISEVRLRDALLRAGNASELFTNAVEQSNKAFEENTALSEEAETRYETLESKLGMLRNQVNDVAIEFGGPLVDALKEGLIAATPIIEQMSALARGFSEASPEMQQTIIKTLALTAALGPVSSVLGRVISIGGATTSGLGKMSLWMGRVSGGAKTVTSETVAMGSGMAGASTKAAGLVSAMGTFGPAALLVGSAIAAGTIAWKLWGEEAVQSSKEMIKWGAVVGEETDKTLTSFQSDMQGMKTEMDIFATGVRENANGVSEHVIDMVANIAEANENLKNNNKETLESLSGVLRDNAEKELKDQEQQADKSLSNAQKASENIQKIYALASKERRELTDQERIYIRQSEDTMTKAMLDNLGIYGEERKQIEQALYGDLSSMNMKQIQDRRSSLKNVLKEELTSYEAQKNALADIYGKGTKEYAEQLSVLEKTHATSTNGIIRSYAEMGAAIGLEEKDIIEALRQMGYSQEQYEAAVGESVENTIEVYGDLLRTTKHMSSEQKEAARVWNDDIMFDDKTGTIHTNTEEAVTEWLDGNATWRDDVNFLVKNADLKSNAKQELMKVLVENGKWDSLDWITKQALIETNHAEAAYQFLTNNKLWDGLNYKDKMAILNSNSPETLKKILQDLGVWEKMDPSRQDLIMSTNADAERLKWMESFRSWDRMHFPNKTATITTRYQTIGSAPRGAGPFATYEKGTNNHGGGLAWLGDGGRHEPYLTPQGQFGVSPNDWTLYDLPKGSKVWPSIQRFMSDIPKFSSGTNIGETRLMQAISRVGNTQKPNNRNQEKIIVENNTDNYTLSEIKTVLEELLFTTKNQKVEWNDRELGRMVTAVGRN